MNFLKWWKNKMDTNKEDYEKLRLLIETISNIDRTDLRKLQNLLNNIVHTGDVYLHAENHPSLSLKESSKDKDKQQL